MQAEKAAAASDDEGNSANPLGAFVTDELMAGGFLRALLQQFLEEISLCQQGPGPGQTRLKADASCLRVFVQQAFGWNLEMSELRSAPRSLPVNGQNLRAGGSSNEDEESDDEAPVIVDLHQPYAL